MMDSIVALPPWYETGLARLLIGSGHRTELGGNKPLQLGADDAAWFIVHGKVEVFAAGEKENHPVARRHLATLQAGEMFFSSRAAGHAGPRRLHKEDGGRAPGQRVLVALPHPGTQLIRVDTAHLVRLACDPGSARLIDQAVKVWAVKLLKFLQLLPFPSSSTALGAGGEFHVASSGLSAQIADGLVWVIQMSGRSALCGHEEILFAEGDGPVPLGEGSWLLSLSEARLACFSTQQVFENGQFWEGAAWLHRIVLRSLITEMPTNASVERARLHRRIELDTQVLESANAQLAAVLKLDDSAESSVLPGARAQLAGATESKGPASVWETRKENGGGSHAADASSGGEDALVAACRIVAEKLGASLRPPHDLSPAMPTLRRLQRLCDCSCLHSRKVLLRGDWWRRDSGPLVAFLADAEDAGSEIAEDYLRPVALLPSGSASYQLVDPETGQTAAVDEHVAKGLREQAFVLYPAPLEALLRPRDLLKPLLHRHWRDLMVIAGMALAGGLLNLLVPVVTGAIYGRIIPNGYRQELGQMALVLLAAALGGCAFQITRALSVLRLTGKVELHMQPLVWGRLLALPVSFFRRFRVGDLADRVEGIGTIRRILLADVTTTALALVSSVASFALLFYYSWRLALLAGLLVVCLVSATAMLALFQLKHRRRSMEVQGKISSLAFALVQGISKLRSSGAEMRSYGVWAGQVAGQSRHALRAQRMAGIQASLNAFYLVASELALFALMGYGLHGRLSLSAFLAFAAAFGQIQAALLTFISLIPELLLIFPVYKRLQPVLEEMTEADESKIAVDLSGDLEVRDVSFRYHGQGSLVLDGVSFKAKRGEFMTIVGPSGSGKSTLIRLLLGFERPLSGSVLYDNLNLASLDVKAVRRQIGTVLQNSKPITGDIFTNIAGGTSNDLEAAWEAARIAGIDEEIRAMPMGMHTIIGEGATTFSGGERQRLMIARAVVNRPRLIFLDEATSSLDTPTQDKVQRCLEQMNATRIVVAHRLSTIRNAARIYVFDGGRIVEEGTYLELMRRCGYFADMANRQT